MRLVAVVDGSCGSELALRHACRSLGEGDEVVLLAVSPRGGQGYLECGRMVLEAALRRCAGALSRVRVRTRLAVGDPRAIIPEVAAEENAAVVTMGAVGSGEPPYGSPLGDAARAAWSACSCPLLVGSPRGVELLAGEERLLVATRRAAAPRRHAPPATECDAVHRKPVERVSAAREGGGYNQVRKVLLSSENSPERVFQYRPPGPTDREAFLLYAAPGALEAVQHATLRRG